MKENYIKYLERLIPEAKIDLHHEYTKDIKDLYIKLCTSLLIENQFLLYAKYENSDKNIIIDNYADIIRKVFPNLLMHKLIAVQPSLGPITKVFDKEGEYEISMRSLHRKTDFKDANFIEKLTKELDFEVLSDLRNNCGTVAKLPKNIDNLKLYCKIFELKNCIVKKTNIKYGKKLWIVLNNSMLDKIQLPIDWAFDVHIVDGFPDNNILMGKIPENPLDHTYFYCPYVFLQKLGPILDHETYEPKYGACSRYGKKLLKDGSSRFGKIVLE